MPWFAEFMAWVAFAFFVIQCVLMASADLAQARDLKGIARRWKRAVRGTFNGQLEHRIEQVGRSKGDNTIHFHDRHYGVGGTGGTLITDGEQAPVVLGKVTGVWLDEKRLRAAASAPNASWDHAYERARKPKGYARCFEAPVPDGSRVWALGELARGRLEPLEGQLEIATIDPVAWCQRKRRIVLSAVAVQILILVVLCTAVLWPPRFGTVSTIAAAISLVYFLAVQQLGKTIRDLVRRPPTAIVRGSWSQPTQS